MSFKDELKCHLCKWILDEPVSLPCRCCWICACHLDDIFSLSKYIKCFLCDRTHQMKRENFRPSKEGKHLIEKELFLTDNEKHLKNQIQTQFNKFQEKMNAKIEMYEATTREYFNNVKEILGDNNLAYKEFEVCKTINKKYLDLLEENQLNLKYKSILNEFRNPFLNFAKINELGCKQELIYRKIELEFDRAIRFISNDVIKKDAFKRKENLIQSSSDCKKDNVKLKEIKSLKSSPLIEKSPFQSKILTKKQANDLIELCGFIRDDKWMLLYRGTRDSFSAKSFHFKCNGKTPTLTIYQVKESNFIFGAYTNVKWDSSNEFKSDPNAFIFSLTNKYNKPCKLNASKDDYSIKCSPLNGPSFGYGPDICVGFYPNYKAQCYSNLGFSYKHPQYNWESIEARTFLAGYEHFRLNEIEVYCRYRVNRRIELKAFKRPKENLNTKVKRIRVKNSFEQTGNILSCKQEKLDLIRLCEFDLNSDWTLLYKGTRDGFGAHDFHSKCDAHANTLTIVKAKPFGNIFGAFTSVEWSSSNAYKYDLNAFIFSLTNRANKPCKMRTSNASFSIKCFTNCGPCFGLGDLYIANDSNENINSYSDLGFGYKHAQYGWETREAREFLAGVRYFQLLEIEVFEISNRQNNRKQIKHDLMFSIDTDPFKSKILTKNQSLELIGLCEFSFLDKWSLLYRASRDGFGAKDFHSNCDNKHPTLIILKAKQSEFIFGGYTSVSWSSSSYEFKLDVNAFIFSLTNKQKQSYKLKTTNATHSIVCSPGDGPIFGAGPDIEIVNNANIEDSRSNLSWTYEHPQYEFKSNDAQTFLTGSESFQLCEIEVYQKN